MPRASVDILRMPLEQFGRYWPPWLAEELASVGVPTVGDLLTLTPLDIVCSPKGSRGLLQAVFSECQDHLWETDQEWRLQEFWSRPGISRPLRPAVPFKESWGCLCLPLPQGVDSEQGKNLLVERIRSFFGRAGLRATSGATALRDDEFARWEEPPSPVVPHLESLTEEDVLVTWSSGLGLVVLSRRQELAGEDHPLIPQLGDTGPIATLRAIPGDPIDAAVLDHGLPQPLSSLLKWTVHDPEASSEMLLEARVEPRRFCALLGLEVRGFAATISWLAAPDRHGLRRVGGDLREAIDSHFGHGRVLHFRR